jgi:hypothetical protein
MNHRTAAEFVGVLLHSSTATAMKQRDRKKRP